jgi:hypothetical protein
MSEEQAPAGEDTPKQEPAYTREQKIAITATMLSHISSDLGLIAKTLTEKDNGHAYEISYEDVAILSNKALRAKSSIAALARIFNAELPEGQAADIAASTTPAKTTSDVILTDIQKAILGNKTPINEAVVSKSVHDGADGA